MNLPQRRKAKRRNDDPGEERTEPRVDVWPEWQRIQHRLKILRVKLWYSAFLGGGVGWIVGHYWIARHAPEQYIVIGAGLLIAYGVWGLRQQDLPAFAKSMGGLFRSVKGKDESAK